MTVTVTSQFAGRQKQIFFAVAADTLPTAANCPMALGQELEVGALAYTTDTPAWQVWTGSAWVAYELPPAVA